MKRGKSGIGERKTVIPAINLVFEKNVLHKKKINTFSKIVFWNLDVCTYHCKISFV